MNVRVFIGSILSLLPSAAWSQCGNGVPSAGNPGCIPPDAYYHQGNGGTSSYREVWENHWGAIAQDKETGRGGFAKNQGSESEAKKNALTNCKDRGGSNCEIILVYRNTCVAAAIGATKGTGFSTSLTEDEAGEKVIARCHEYGDHPCKVVYSACSLPVRVQ